MILFVSDWSSPRDLATAALIRVKAFIDSRGSILNLNMPGYHKLRIYVVYFTIVM